MQRSRKGFGMRVVVIVAVVALMMGIPPRGMDVGTTRAQGAGSPTAAITPADGVFYGVATYDPASAKWGLGQELYSRFWGSGTLGMVPMQVFGMASGTPPAFPIDMPGMEGAEVAVAVVGATPIYRLAASMIGPEVMGALTTLVGSADPVAAGEIPPGAAYLVAAPDPSMAVMFVDSAMNGVAASMGLVIESSEYGGVSIMAAPASPGQGFFGYAYAVVGSVVVMSTHAETIHAFIDVQNGDASSLEATSAYAAAAAALPGDRLAFAVFSGAAFAAAVEAGPAETKPLGMALMPLVPMGLSVGMAMTPIAEGIRFDTVDIPADGAADAVGRSGGVALMVLNAVLAAIGVAAEGSADNPALALLPAERDGVVFLDLSTVEHLRPGGGGSGVEAPAECGNYAGRDAAQAAFDADPAGLAILDSNGNGTVCDDYMGQPVEAAATGPGVTSLTMTSFVEGGLQRTVAIIAIG